MCAVLVFYRGVVCMLQSKRNMLKGAPFVNVFDKRPSLHLMMRFIQFNISSTPPVSLIWKKLIKYFLNVIMADLQGAPPSFISFALTGLEATCLALCWKHLCTECCFVMPRDLSVSNGTKIAF